MTKSVLFVGVGGQGTILASKILSEGLVRMGYDVKMAEIHGMAQRGGSVLTQVKFGKEVYSPTIGKGEADVIVAFEKVEALRWLPYLKKGGVMIVNDTEIYSLPVLTEAEVYPDGIVESLQKSLENVKVLDAVAMATELGNAKAMNTVLLGALIQVLKLDGMDWPELVKELTPPKVREVNAKAFLAGKTA